jgi:hypothetical protein
MYISVRSEADAKVNQPVLIIYYFAPDCRPLALQTDEPAHAPGLVSRYARQRKGISGGSTRRPVTFTRRLRDPQRISRKPSIIHRPEIG